MADSDNLWYHGTQDTGLTKFSPLEDIVTVNGNDMGSGTYITRDKEWASEYGFPYSHPDARDYLPDPRSAEGRDWISEARLGRVLSVQFHPRNPAYYDPDKDMGHEYDQADAAYKAGHDAFIHRSGDRDRVALSFEPHKNLTVVRVDKFEDIDVDRRDPRTFLEEESGRQGNYY